MRVEATGWTEASSLQARGTERGSTRGVLPWSGWRRLPKGNWPVRRGRAACDQRPQPALPACQGAARPPHRTRPRRLRCRGYDRRLPARPRPITSHHHTQSCSRDGLMWVSLAPWLGRLVGMVGGSRGTEFCSARLSSSTSWPR